MIKLTTKATGELLLVGTLGALLVLSAPGRIVAVEPDAAVAPAPPALVTPPVASGLMRIGQVLSSTDGVWSNATSWSYQWKRNGVPITGEVAATYTVVAADIAALITCEVTATGPGGTSAPETSNALTSPWRPILLARPGVLIWDYLDSQCYAGATVGAPVSEIRTVDGVVIGAQATSGARPTRGTSGLVFDGVDDHLICNALANVVEQAHTIVFGFDLSTDAATTTKTLFTASAITATTTTRQVSVNYSRPDLPNATRQRYLVGDISGVSLALTSYSVGLGPYNMALRAAAPGGAMSAVILDGSLTSITSGTRSANDGIVFDWLYIGARALGASPTVSQYWQGRLRHFALDDTRWSDTDTQTYRACAIAAGVM